MKQKLVFLSKLIVVVNGINAQTKTGLHVVNTFHIAIRGG